MREHLAWAAPALRVLNYAAWSPLCVAVALTGALPPALAMLVILALPVEIAYKWALERPRPDGEPQGLPSGDVLIATVLYGGLVGWWATPLVTLVALARIVQSRHYPLDVIGGALLGLGLLRLL